jgi:hypothetical protein
MTARSAMSWNNLHPFWPVRSGMMSAAMMAHERRMVEQSINPPKESFFQTIQNFFQIDGARSVLFPEGNVVQNVAGELKHAGEAAFRNYVGGIWAGSEYLVDVAAKATGQTGAEVAQDLVGYAAKFNPRMDAMAAALIQHGAQLEKGVRLRPPENAARVFRQALFIGPDVDPSDPDAELVAGLREDIKRTSPEVYRFAQEARQYADDHVVKTILWDIAAWMPIGFAEVAGAKGAGLLMQVQKGRKYGVLADTVVDMGIAAADAMLFVPGKLEERVAPAALGVGLGAGIGGGFNLLSARAMRRAKAPSLPDAAPAPDFLTKAREMLRGLPAQEPFETALPQHARGVWTQDYEHMLRGFRETYHDAERQYVIAEAKGYKLGDDIEAALAGNADSPDFARALNSVLEERANRISQELSEQMRSIQKEYPHLDPESLNVLAQRVFDMRFKAGHAGIELQVDLRMLPDMQTTLTDDLVEVYSLPPELRGQTRRVQGEATVTEGLRRTEGTVQIDGRTVDRNQFIPVLRVAIDLVADTQPGQTARHGIHELAEVWVAVMERANPRMYRRLAAEIQEMYARFSPRVDTSEMSPARVAQLFVKTLEHDAILKQHLPGTRTNFLAHMAKKYGGWVADLLTKVREWKNKYVRVQNAKGQLVGGGMTTAQTKTATVGQIPAMPWSKELQKTVDQFRRGDWDVLFDMLTSYDSPLMRELSEASRKLRNQTSVTGKRTRSTRTFYMEGASPLEVPGLLNRVAVGEGVREQISRAVSSRDHALEALAILRHPEAEKLAQRAETQAQAVDDLTAFLRKTGAEVDPENATFWSTLDSDTVRAIVAANADRLGAEANLSAVVKALGYHSRRQAERYGADISSRGMDAETWTRSSVALRHGDVSNAPASRVIAGLADENVGWAQDIIKLGPQHPHYPSSSETFAEWVSTVPRSEITDSWLPTVQHQNVLSRRTDLGGPAGRSDLAFTTGTAPELDRAVQLMSVGDEVGYRTAVGQHGTARQTADSLTDGITWRINQARRRMREATTPERQADAMAEVVRLERIKAENPSETFIVTRDGGRSDLTPRLEERMLLTLVDHEQARLMNRMTGGDTWDAGKVAQARRAMLSPDPEAEDLALALTRSQESNSLHRELVEAIDDAKSMNEARGPLAPRETPILDATTETRAFRLLRKDRSLTGHRPSYSLESPEDAMWRLEAESKAKARQLEQAGHKEAAEVYRAASGAAKRLAQTTGGDTSVDPVSVLITDHYMPTDMNPVTATQTRTNILSFVNKGLEWINYGIDRAFVDRFAQAARLDPDAGNVLNLVAAAPYHAAYLSKRLAGYALSDLNPRQKELFSKLGMWNRVKQMTAAGESPGEALPRLTALEETEIKNDPKIAEAILRWKKAVEPEIVKMRIAAGLPESALVQTDDFFLPLHRYNPDFHGHDVTTFIPPLQRATQGVNVPRTKGRLRARGTANEYVSDPETIISMTLAADMQAAAARRAVDVMKAKGLLLNKRPKDGMITIDGKEYPAIATQIRRPSYFEKIIDTEVGEEYVGLWTTGENYWAPKPINRAWDSVTSEQWRAVKELPGFKIWSKFMDYMVGALLATPVEAFAHAHRMGSIAAVMSRQREFGLRKLFEAAVPYVGPRLSLVNEALHVHETPQVHEIMSILSQIGGVPLRGLEEATLPGPLKRFVETPKGFLFGVPEEIIGRPTTKWPGQDIVSRGLRRAGRIGLDPDASMPVKALNKLNPIAYLNRLWGFDTRLRVIGTYYWIKAGKAAGTLPEHVDISWMAKHRSAYDNDLRKFLTRLGNYNAEMQSSLLSFLRTTRLQPFSGAFSARVGEVKTLVGFDGMPKSPDKWKAAASIGQTLWTGTVGTMLFKMGLNWSASGRWPWDNEPGREFDVSLGVKDKNGKELYIDGRLIDPAYDRASRFVGLRYFSDKRYGLTSGQRLRNVVWSRAGYGTANEALQAFAGAPGLSFLSVAMTGKAPWLTPGGEMLQVSRPALRPGEQARNNLMAAVANMNPNVEMFLHNWTNHLEEIHDPTLWYFATLPRFVMGKFVESGRPPLVAQGDLARQIARSEADVRIDYLRRYMDATESDSRTEILQQYLDQFEPARRAQALNSFLTTYKRMSAAPVRQGAQSVYLEQLMRSGELNR